MYNYIKGLLLLSLFHCSVSAQTIIPTDFYGSNTWMPDSIGLVRYYSDLHDHWEDIQNANVKLMRIGGIAYDKNFFTNYQIIKEKF